MHSYRGPLSQEKTITRKSSQIPSQCAEKRRAWQMRSCSEMVEVDLYYRGPPPRNGQVTLIGLIANGCWVLTGLYTASNPISSAQSVVIALLNTMCTITFLFADSKSWSWRQRLLYHWASSVEWRGSKFATSENHFLFFSGYVTRVGFEPEESTHEQDTKGTHEVFEVPQMMIHPSFRGV